MGFFRFLVGLKCSHTHVDQFNLQKAVADARTKGSNSMPSLTV